jgi:hypothetical protein
MILARLFAPLLALAIPAATFALEPITYSGREALTGRSAQGGSDSTQCAKLAREMDDLKGKPLRRSAAAERYAAECKNPPPTPAPKGPLQ